jgi:hypothetical protein
VDVELSPRGLSQSGARLAESAARIPRVSHANREEAEVALKAHNSTRPWRGLRRPAAARTIVHSVGRRGSLPLSSYSSRCVYVCLRVWVRRARVGERDQKGGARICGLSARGNNGPAEIKSRLTVNVARMRVR